MYEDLLVQLRTSIRQGLRQPGEFVGTEQAFGRERGLSRVSVRRATDQLIREGLVERRPGKGLFVRPVQRSLRTIQVVVPDLAFEQCIQIAKGAQQLGIEHGLNVQVYDAQSQMDRDIECLRQLPERSADGALILSWHHPRFTEALLELKQRNLPFVLIDEESSPLDIDTVAADNHAGGMLAANALIDLGHRSIGFIGNLSAGTVAARLEGLRDAVGDRGLPFDRSRVIDLAIEPGMDWAQRIADSTHELMSRSPRPTAIFYSNDHVAAEGYRTLRAMNLRVPEDVSVVGFDDSPLCRWLEPALSTVRQPSIEMGQVAMSMLMEMLQTPVGQPRRPARKATLPVQWIARASIGPCPTIDRGNN